MLIASNRVVKAKIIKFCKNLLIKGILDVN